jgi:hypothetical protein
MPDLRLTRGRVPCLLLFLLGVYMGVDGLVAINTHPLGPLSNWVWRLQGEPFVAALLMVLAWRAWRWTAPDKDDQDR